ncbi:MAG: glycosyltransferase [Pararhodobacter sp.]|nr:glycosyltransferase [Pararhodobacter sp.]
MIGSSIGPAGQALQDIPGTEPAAGLPRRMNRGNPVILEQDFDDQANVFEIIGKIVGTGTTELRDLILHVDFVDAAGASVAADESGLVKADSGRYFFYPLGIVEKDTGRFAKTVFVPAAACRATITLSVWRFREEVTYSVEALEIRRSTVRILSPETSFAGLLDMLIRRGELDASGRALDVASMLPDPGRTLDPIARTFASPVDCHALYPNPKQRWMDIRRMREDCVSCVAPAGPYALISIYPHGFGLPALLTQLETLSRHLEPQGVVITTMPVTMLDALPRPPGQQGPGGRLSALNAELEKALVPLEVIALVPPATPGEAETCWIAMRQIELARLAPDFFPLLLADDLPGAAATMRQFCIEAITGKRTPTSAPWAARFEAMVATLDTAGRYDEALNCMLCAAAFAPDKPNLRLEAAGRSRGRGDLATAQALLEHFLKDFPGHVGALLNLALVLVMIGRGEEAMDLAEDYIGKAGRNVTVSARRSLSMLFRQFARQCAMVGQATEATDPLLDPEIAAAFLADPEAHAQLWYRPRLTRLFAQDAIDRRALRDAAQRAAGAPPADRPLRILIMSGEAWAFVVKMVAALGLRPDQVELQSFDFAALDGSIAKDHLHELYAPVSMGGDPDAVWQRATADQAILGQLVDWCDVVFCEWAVGPAIWLSRYLPPHKRLIVRLHSYEAFTSWPYFINFGGIDGMVFVADHIRRITDLRFRFQAHCPRSIVLQNFNDPSVFPTAKAPGANRTLGMLGYANRNKDPLFALQILAKLRKSDPAWRLMLVGKDWKEDSSREAEQAHLQACRDFEAAQNLGDAIEYVPYTSRIEEPLSRIGFILSCSHREGTHEAILEGMACGAVPVIRRWPMVAGLGAPETSYPGLTCIDTVDEAVAQILALAEPDRFAAASAQAASYARRQFDLGATTDAFLEFVNDILAER